MTVTAEVRVTFRSVDKGPAGAGTRRQDVTADKILQFADGTGVGQADRVYVSEGRTLSASGTENLDLTGSLTDAFGATISAAEVVAIMVVAASTNTNNVQVRNASSNGVPLFLGASSPGVAIPPGGAFVFAGPGAAGIATITGSTGDLLTVTNSGSGTSVSYDIYLLLRSA